METIATLADVIYDNIFVDDYAYKKYECIYPHLLRLQDAHVTEPCMVEAGWFSEMGLGRTDPFDVEYEFIYLLTNLEYMHVKNKKVLAAVSKMNRLFFDNKYSKYISFNGIKNTI